MQLARTTVRCLCCIAFLSLGACRDGTGPAEEIGSVTITAPHTDIAAGATVQLSATVLSRSGTVMPGAAVAWTSSELMVASVSPTGLVTGVGAGTALMTARSGPYTGTVAITVGAGPCTAATAGSIVPGETRTGLGQIGGCVLRSDGLVIGWELGIDARTRVRLHATTSLWPGLIVTSADLDAEWSAFLARSRYGDEHSALAVLDLDPGDYIIWLKQGSEEPEAYTLSVDALEIVPCIPVGSVAPLQVVTGTLTTAGCRPDFRLEYIAEPWTIILFRDRTVGIKLTSTTFDARLFIMSPFGSVGGEHANDALVLVTPALGGPFTLWVTSRDESSAGPYELAVYGSEPCTATVTGRVALGDHRAGTLVYTDCTLGDSELVAGWALDLDAAAHVRVRAGSVDFDPYVAITDGDLNRVQLSWDWPDDEIVVYTVEPLPAGRHIIWVGSHDHKTGSYEFDVQAADPR